MSTAPMISVVIPTYNRVRHLEAALASVTAQTFEEWECLVCDDGSSDGTEDIICARSREDLRIRWLPGPRYGLPAGPRNRGIREAGAPWIAFLDDDDLWHREKLATQWRLAAESACHCVSVTSMKFLDGERAVFSTDGRSHAKQLSLADVLLKREPYPSTPATMVRRDRLLDLGGFAESPAYRAVEDFDLWCRLLSDPHTLWLMDTGQPLVAFRDQGTDSISAWYRVLSPDVVRQRWAQIEVITRHLGPDQLTRSERTALRHALLERADDCAARCLRLGWRSPALAAYFLATLNAIALGQPAGAVRRLVRASRHGMVSRLRSHQAEPATVRSLVKRSLAHSLLQKRHCLREPLGHQSRGDSSQS